MFGALIPLKSNFTHALEIGSGTGFISLMLAQKHSQLLIKAIDIQQKAYELTKLNFANSAWAERLTALYGDFKDFNFNHKFDVIFSNPPFYVNSLKSKQNFKNICKHTTEQLHTDILNFAQHYLAESGMLWLLLPLNESEKLIKNNSTNLTLVHQIKFYKSEDTPEFRIMLGFSKIKKNLITEECIIYISTQSLVYTNQVKSLLQPYYLYL